MKAELIKRVAQTGLVAKGTVYILLGLLAFMAAFEMGRKENSEATQSGALQFVKSLPAGEVLLLVVAAGLLCYCVWRFIQAVRAGNDKKGWKKRLRYGFSGLAYLALAVSAVKIVGGKQPSGDRNQQLAGELMDKPFGQILVGISGLILVAVGAYQVWYGFSEKYRKHVQELSLQTKHSALLLRSGKVGYISRGAVWLVIAFLFLRAAVHAAASEAGNTAKAFRFIEDSPYGSELLGLVGVGLMAYGAFNYVRARYERLEA
jgi:uncharacterized membrane protein HdeD (DUF308 family)